MYWANNEGREEEKLCRNEKFSGEQRKVESFYKPILGLITYDDELSVK
jgi:hypothetical protein